jgi:hypothetical protein
MWGSQAPRLDVRIEDAVVECTAQMGELVGQRLPLRGVRVAHAGHGLPEGDLLLGLRHHPHVGPRLIAADEDVRVQSEAWTGGQERPSLPLSSTGGEKSERILW